MRIAVHERIRMEQVPGRPQVIDDFVVRLPDVHPAQPIGHGIVVAPVCAHRAVDIQPLAHGGELVLGAVAGRGVDQTRAIFKRHVISMHDGAGAIAERMAIAQADQRRPLHFGEDFNQVALGLLGDPVHKVSRDHREAAIDLHQSVSEPLVDGDGQVGRERPRRGGPDHQRRRLIKFHAERSRDGLAIGCLEIHIDRQILLVVVLQLRLGERGLVLDRPVHRFERAADQPLLDEVGKNFEHRLLVCRVHREIRVVKVRQGHHALHLGGLDLLVLLGVPGTCPPNNHPAIIFAKGVKLRHLARLDEVQHDPVLDRQSVTVPAGDEATSLPGHQPAANDEILEHSIEHGPDVQRAAGVGRAVMENERLGLLTGRNHFLVQRHPLPPGQRLRLGLDQARPHGKRRLGQVERLLVVGLGRLGHQGSGVRGQGERCASSNHRQVEAGFPRLEPLSLAGSRVGMSP